MNTTPTPALTVAQRVALAARAFHEQQTGRLPGLVTVALNQDVLVITLHKAMSPAECAMALSAEGTKKVQEYHKRLFEQSCEKLRREIHAITGVAVGEGATQIVASTGTVVFTFASGTMVQVFLLADATADGALAGINGAEACSGHDSALA